MKIKILKENNFNLEFLILIIKYVRACRHCLHAGTSALPDPPPLEANGIPLAKAGLHLRTHACALALLGHLGDFFSCRKMTQAGML